MIDDVLYFVEESPEAHGVFAQYTPTQRMAYCQARSVGYNEFYRARENGLEPVLVFKLADAKEYAGEKIVLYGGKRYRVIRVYIDAAGVELTVEDATIDRGENEYTPPATPTTPAAPEPAAPPAEEVPDND